jgi:hypothetical protein
MMFIYWTFSFYGFTFSTTVARTWVVLPEICLQVTSSPGSNTHIHTHNTIGYSIVYSSLPETTKCKKKNMSEFVYFRMLFSLWASYRIPVLQYACCQEQDTSGSSDNRMWQMGSTVFIDPCYTVNMSIYI